MLNATFEEVQAEQYDALLIPGGRAPEYLRLNEDVHRIVWHFAEAQELMDERTVPWWTLSGLRIALFRPIASLSIWLHHRRWPRRTLAMHLHTLAWYVSAVAAAATLYRHISGTTWTTGLAELPFAADAAHAFSFSWLANRRALLALLFGSLSIGIFDRWRHGGRRWAGLAVPGPLAIPFLCGESGVATMGYLATYAHVLDRGTWKTRGASRLPAAVVLFLCWVALGCRCQTMDDVIRLGVAG